MGLASKIQKDRVSAEAGRIVDDSQQRRSAKGDLAGIMDRLKSLEFSISQERGEFELFGLFLREGTIRWDFVISAAWVGANKTADLEYLAGKLMRSLTSDALMLISRIVPLNPKDQFVLTLQEMLDVQHGDEQISDIDVFGVQISRGYIVTCHRNRGLPRSRR